jgi:hypothetical protein
MSGFQKHDIVAAVFPFGMAFGDEKTSLGPFDGSEGHGTAGDENKRKGARQSGGCVFWPESQPGKAERLPQTIHGRPESLTSYGRAIRGETGQSTR